MYERVNDLKDHSDRQDGETEGAGGTCPFFDCDSPDPKFILHPHSSAVLGLARAREAAGASSCFVHHGN